MDQLQNRRTHTHFGIWLVHYTSRKYSLHLPEMATDKSSQDLYESFAVRYVEEQNHFLLYNINEDFTCKFSPCKASESKYFGILLDVYLNQAHCSS